MHMQQNRQGKHRQRSVSRYRTELGDEVSKISINIGDFLVIKRKMFYNNRQFTD